MREPVLGRLFGQEGGTVYTVQPKTLRFSDENTMYMKKCTCAGIQTFISARIISNVVSPVGESCHCTYDCVCTLGSYNIKQLFCRARTLNNVFQNYVLLTQINVFSWST